MAPPWKSVRGTSRGSQIDSGSAALWGMLVPAATCSGSSNGPRSRKFIRRKAIWFIITVVRISLTPKRAFSRPGMPPHMSPAAAPLIRVSGSRIRAGIFPNPTPKAVAASAPTTICPSPPMFITPPRKAMQMPRPTNSSGVALVRVCVMPLTLPSAPRISAL